jgi:hypothetical protein
MKFCLYLVCVITVLLLISVPVSGIPPEPEGRYYAGGGSSPLWNTEPGTLFLSGGFNASLGWSGAVNDSWISPYGASGGVWSRQQAVGLAGWASRYETRVRPVGGQWLLLTGGLKNAGAGGNYTNDTWISTNGGVTWAATNMSGGWQMRAGHAVFSSGNAFVIAGGMGDAAKGYGGYYNDSWVSYDWGTTYTRTNATRALWHARYLSAFTQSYGDGSKFYMFGGLNNSVGAENDCWWTADNGATWTQTKVNTGTSVSSPGAPAARYNAALVSTKWGLILIGGVVGAAESGEVWRSTDDGATWTQVNSMLYFTRQAPVVGYDPVRHVISMTGGVAGGLYMGDNWVSRDGGVTWYPYYQAGYGAGGSYTFTSYYGGDWYNMGIAGAGGAGMSSTNATLGYQSGSGGWAGQWANYTHIPTTVSVGYPILVGTGGTTGGINTGVANAGGLSSAFGKTKQGGLGGALQGVGSGDIGGTGTGYGLAGNSTNFFTNVRLGYNSSGAGSIVGLGGLGYGAGGGGAGNSGTSPHSAYVGGQGATGLVAVWTNGYYGEYSPRFTASPSTTTIGTVINFTDISETRIPAGVDYTWDFGDGTTSKTQGNTTHAYGYAGTFTPSLRITSSYGDLTETQENLIVITGSNSQTWYSPSQVRFTVLDYLGNNIVGATVNATYVQSTMPTAQAWLQNVYGVSSAVATEMLSANTVMSGQTGDDGAVVFTMHSSLQYNVSAWNSSSFIQTRIYPKEPDYNIWLPKPSVNNTYAQIGYNLTFWEPNASYFTMGATYQDNSSLSKNLTFYVNATNGTIINYTHIRTSLGTTTYNITKTIPNTRGEAFYWGLKVERPRTEGGNISVDRGVSSKGASGVLVDLRLPSSTYYPWIAMFLLFMIAALASKMNVRFMLVLMAAMAAMFWWFGWMSGQYLAAVIPFAGLLGAVYYMKGSLRENYGIGGSGSMLVNIVVFMIILQMMVGFISSLGVFSQSAMANPQNEFSNVDLTTIQNSTQNFGGINDPLQSANSFASIGWATMKIVLNMIGAVFVVGIYLIEMFPYIPPGFFMILQAGIYILYVFFIVKLVGKAGSEVDL